MVAAGRHIHPNLATLQDTYLETLQIRWQALRYDIEREQKVQSAICRNADQRGFEILCNCFVDVLVGRSLLAQMYPAFLCDLTHGEPPDSRQIVVRHLWFEAETEQGPARPALAREAALDPVGRVGANPVAQVGPRALPGR